MSREFFSRPLTRSILRLKLFSCKFINSGKDYDLVMCSTGHLPALVCSTVQVPGTTKHHNHDQLGSSILESIFDSRLWAVPKSRRSLERRMTRRMGGLKHFETYGRPKNNIVACLECGHWHEKHTICGKLKQHIDDFE